jgi:hypothetical protein
VPCGANCALLCATRSGVNQRRRCDGKHGSVGDGQAVRALGECCIEYGRDRIRSPRVTSSGLAMSFFAFFSASDRSTRFDTGYLTSAAGGLSAFEPVSASRFARVIGARARACVGVCSHAFVATSVRVCTRLSRRVRARNARGA